MGLLHVKSHWTLSPSPLTYYSPPSPPLQPHTPLSGCRSPGEEGGGVTGSKSFPLWISGLAGRGLPENGCIRAGVGGQDFNSVKEQLVWVSPHFSLPSLSPQIQGDEKFVQRGTSKIKKVYSPKSYPCPALALERNAITSAFGLGVIDLKQGSAFCVLVS